MKTLEDYLRDPDLADESLPLREIHAIRLKIQDDTKDMLPVERAKHASREANALIRQYGLRVKRPGGMAEAVRPEFQ